MSVQRDGINYLLDKTLFQKNLLQDKESELNLLRSQSLELAEKILSFTCAQQADTGQMIDVWPDEDEFRGLVMQARIVKELAERKP